MMEFFYKTLLSEEVFNKMNIFGIKFGPKIPKYLFNSLGTVQFLKKTQSV